MESGHSEKDGCKAEATAMGPEPPTEPVGLTESVEPNEPTDPPPRRSAWLMLGSCLAGVCLGLTLYVAYMSRAWSYASDNPAACVNCHVMGTYYQAWAKSSHATRATCNDCHVPQDGFIKKYAFKAMDGLYHSAVFTVRAEPMAMRPRNASRGAIMQNCVRCHSPMVTEFARMDIDQKQVINGNAKPCWGCHTQLPHTSISSTASATLAGTVPYPAPPLSGRKNRKL